MGLRPRLCGKALPFPGVSTFRSGKVRFLLTDRPDLRYLPPELWLRRLTCLTILKIPFFRYSRPLSTPNCGRFAVSAAVHQRPPRRGAAQVCPRLTWRTTYSREPAPPCTSPNSWRAFNPPSMSTSIARAWSLRSPRKWPVAIAFCAPARTLSLYVRRPDDSLRRLVADRRRLGA